VTLTPWRGTSPISHFMPTRLEKQRICDDHQQNCRFDVLKYAHLNLISEDFLYFADDIDGDGVRT
jgi:hypothetical protein